MTVQVVWPLELRTDGEQLGVVAKELPVWLRLQSIVPVGVLPAPVTVAVNVIVGCNVAPFELPVTVRVGVVLGIAVGLQLAVVGGHCPSPVRKFRSPVYRA